MTTDNTTPATSAMRISDDQDQDGKPAPPNSTSTPTATQDAAAVGPAGGLGTTTDIPTTASPADTTKQSAEPVPTQEPTAAPAAAAAAADGDATLREEHAYPAAALVHDGVPTEGPLAELSKLLPGLVAETGHSEMWGIKLTSIVDTPCCIVLQKFLRANDNDAEKAAEQLKTALMWRHKFRPLETLTEEHSREKFDGLGYVTHHKPPNDIDDTPETVITWNIYGGVEDKKATFSDVDQFCRWRVALMELGIQGLKINEATAPIPEGGDDMYRMIQVHDYMDVSFLRLDPEIKAASGKVIEIFQTGYPELLEHKYFVNVPYFMNWLFNFFKLFMAKETIAKFHPMAKGTMLASELPTIADTLPGAYGGRAPALRDDQSAIVPGMAGDAPESGGDGEAGAELAPEAAPENNSKPPANEPEKKRSAS